MRQAGVLAAAGIYALDHIAPKLHEDHANAQILAKGAWIKITVLSLGWLMFKVWLRKPRVKGNLN